MSGLQEQKLGSVVERFYEAAAQPDLWRAALDETAVALGAEGCLLLAGPKAPLASVWSESLDEGVQFGAREGWYERNPRVERGLAVMRSPQDVITDSRLFSPEELDRLPFHAEFVSRFDLRSFAGLLLAPAGSSGVILSVERRTDQGPFEDCEVAALERIVPHLQRAGHLALLVADARSQGMLDAIETMNGAGLLLDGAGRIVRSNARADRHLGRGLSIAQGQLVASHRAANASLQSLIASAVQSGPAHEASGRGAIALPRPGKAPLVVRAAPVVGSASDVFQRAKALVTIVDPSEHRELAEPLLRQAFGLSPAEARLAIELASGCDLQDIADRRGVEIGTVRTQLKAIFAKTSTHRQAELVALLGRMTRGTP